MAMSSSPDVSFWLDRTSLEDPRFPHLSTSFAATEGQESQDFQMNQLPLSTIERAAPLDNLPDGRFNRMFQHQQQLGRQVVEPANDPPSYRSRTMTSPVSTSQLVRYGFPHSATSFPPTCAPDYANMGWQPQHPENAWDHPLPCFASPGPVPMWVNGNGFPPMLPMWVNGNPTAPMIPMGMPMQRRATTIPAYIDPSVGPAGQLVHHSMPNYTHGVCEYQCIPELSGLSGTSQTRGLSNHFKELTKHGQLSVEQALDIRNVPFITIGKQKEPAPWGVLRIKNIPFNVTKNEIYAFLGHSAHYIDGAQGGAIHIIMERTSGKTVECFVEFQTLSAANRQVIRWRSTSRVGRHQLLGKRFIVLELSSQEVLMAALFPKANCVEWQGQKPVIRPNTEAFSSGFKGFVTQEELVMMVKHAEAPNHTKFARKSPQRVYECLLSTLAKFPWSAGDLITLETRDGLFNTTQSLLKALKIQLKRCSPLLTSTLFRELVTTALQVPGFTEFQKSQIAHGSGNMDDQLSPLADAWPFVALGKIDDAEEDVVRLYASMLKEATTSANLNTLYQQASSVQRTTYYNQSMARTPFGNFYVDWPANRQKMTLAQAAELEWGVLDATLRKALRPANEQISPQNPFAM